jgi:hypothetical protein
MSVVVTAPCRYKTSFGQCKCLWCGRFKGHVERCGVTENMRQALRNYAAASGRTWRSSLIAAWTRGDDVGPDLQTVRNVLGPSGLLRIPARLVRL